MTRKAKWPQLDSARLKELATQLDASELAEQSLVEVISDVVNGDALWLLDCAP